MGRILHGSARTTEAVRRTIQHSQESLMALAGRHGINPKTVAKWKKRAFAHDAPMGPKEIRSTVLNPEEEAAVVALRKHALLRWMTACMRFNPAYREAVYYDSHDQLKNHLQTFLMAYNFARHLKTLKGLTPYEYTAKCGQKNQKDFSSISATMQAICSQVQTLRISALCWDVYFLPSRSMVKDFVIPTNSRSLIG